MALRSAIGVADQVFQVAADCAMRASISADPWPVLASISAPLAGLCDWKAAGWMSVGKAMDQDVRNGVSKGCVVFPVAPARSTHIRPSYSMNREK